MPDQDGPWWRQSLSDTAPYLTLGIQLAAAVLLFFFLGWWVDTAYATSPYGVLIGSAIGITGGMIKFIRTVTSPDFTKDDQQHDGHH